MRILNKIELKLDGYENCYVLCDTNCPIGEIYDYACALKAFIYGKIKEAEGEQQIPGVSVASSSEVKSCEESPKE